MKIYNALIVAALGAAWIGSSASAATFNQQVFAMGSTLGASQPDSLAFGSGSLWVAYTNGADSTGAGGSSLVVRYTPSGQVQKTFSISGSVDGLRIDPSGNVWALQNQDANSALTVINPATNGTTTYGYGASYTTGLNSTMRGFDEAVFTSGQTYLSVTNPGPGTDSIIVPLSSGLVSPLQVGAGLLPSTFTATNQATGMTGTFTITDPDSLKAARGGDLALTGEGDKTIVFVHNIGTAGQSQSYLQLLDTNSQLIAGKADDTVFPTATTGIFFIADTGANTVYEMAGIGLNPNSVFVSEGNVFGSLDTTTGIVTPVLTGTSPHGAEFVTQAASGIPEPATLTMICGGPLVMAGAGYRRRDKNSRRG
jgi:hypothetical protein